MGERNFFKKILATTALVAVPGATKDLPPEKVDTNLTEISVETPKEKTINPKTTAHYHEYSKVEKQKPPEYFISKEYLDSLVNVLRERVGQEILKDKEQFSGNRGFDHILLAIGDIPMSNGMTYMEYVNSFKDSISIENKAEAFDDSHPKSVAYSLLRSGVYDKWKKEGGESEARADSFISKARRPVEYFQDFDRHDYEWTMGIYIELAKRNLDTSIYKYAVEPVDFYTSKNTEEGSNNMFDNKLLDSLKPFSIDELYVLNEQEITFEFNSDKQRKYFQSIDDKISEAGVAVPWNPEETCGAAHALHAVTMYDVYSKDAVKLKSHLDTAIILLEKNVKRAVEENKKTLEYGDNVLHNISHYLLPFTELPDDYKLEPEMKVKVQDAIKVMCDLTEKHFNGENPEEAKNDIIMELAHPIEVLTHLPKCVLEK